jgi:teichuronic acid biosynthesis glycosyltransferase TuaC
VRLIVTARLVSVCIPMGRLRIAVVTPELPSREYPNRGHSVYQTLSRLCEHADVQAFCPLPRYPAFLHPRFDYRETDLSYSLPGLSTRYFEYPAIPLLTRPVNGYTCAHYLEPMIRAFQADVILNFLLYPAGFAALSVGRKLRLPVVLGSIGSDLNAIPDPLSRWLTRKALYGASRIIAKSKDLRARAVSMGADPDTTHVIENGCDENIFFLRSREASRRELKIPQAAELILFVGRMHHRKGVGELLDAVTALSPKRRNLRLVYIGDGPELRPMQDKVQTRGLGNHVQFAGACSSDEVAQWLAAANLLALPSYSEGCPNAVIEALSCGRPVVATAVGGIPDLVKPDCGILVPVGQALELKDALDTALNTDWNEAAIAEGCRRSWKQVAQETLAICEGLRGKAVA